MANTSTTEDYYHWDWDHHELDPQHDAKDAITLLVQQFVRRNQYKDHVSALMDVTPNQWIAQVNKAAEDLEQKLTEAMEQADDLLHAGEYSDGKPCQCP